MPNLDFNSTEPKTMHIDLNSCFATIEQQANPFLRGLPIAVAAYDSPGGCILAPSIEAKRYGVKTGMRVKEGRSLCPSLIVKSPNTQMYRDVHRKLKSLIGEYTPNFVPKSIDEFVLDFERTQYNNLFKVGEEIKSRIKADIGEWLTVSIGIGPNRFLAKTAAGLHKPDGLDVIDVNNYEKIYKSLELLDLNGINIRNNLRLNLHNIYTVWDFYNAPLYMNRAAFESINGYYWYLRLRGWEIDSVEFARKSFGNSYAMPHSDGTKEELLPILQKLTEKTGSRLRASNFQAQGVHLSLSFRERRGYWHKGIKLPHPIITSHDIYKTAVYLLNKCPHLNPTCPSKLQRSGAHVLAVSVFNLSKKGDLQLDMFDNKPKKEAIYSAVDEINDKWGKFVIIPARSLLAQNHVHDRIAFGQGEI